MKIKETSPFLQSIRLGIKLIEAYNTNFRKKRCAMQGSVSLLASITRGVRRLDTEEVVECYYILIKHVSTSIIDRACHSIIFHTK